MWVSGEDLEHFAVNVLRDCKIPEAAAMSGAIDLERYAEDILEAAGYALVASSGGYIFRDEQKYISYSDITAEGPKQSWSGMTMM